MQDIKNFLNQINSAVRGEDVRDAILACLEVLNQASTNAYTLNGHPASFFATTADVENIQREISNIELDTYPQAGSSRGITSGGVYSYMTEIDNALGRILGE